MEPSRRDKFSEYQRRVMVAPRNPASSNGAMAEVLVTYELVEAILLNLQLFDITRVVRVNKYFKSVIEQSQGARKTMFLEFSGVIPAIWKVQHSLKTVTHLPGPHTRADVYHMSGPNELTSYHVPMAINEAILRNSFSSPDRTSARNSTLANDAYIQATDPPYGWILMDVLRRPGSRSDMSLTYPPCTRVLIWNPANRRRPSGDFPTQIYHRLATRIRQVDIDLTGRMLAIENSDGILLRDIISAIQGIECLQPDQGRLGVEIRSDQACIADQDALKVVQEQGTVTAYFEEWNEDEARNGENN